MHSPAKLTLRDVALAAGVSRATVSLALRDHPSLPESTRIRIQTIANELGHRGNPLISTVMAQVRGGAGRKYLGHFAYVTAFADRAAWRRVPTWRRFYEGAVGRSALLGYVVEEFWLKEPGMTPRRFHEILDARQIQGLIIAPLPKPRWHLRMDWARFPSVTLNYSLWKPTLHRAANHHLHSIARALRELKRLGYRRIGLAISTENHERADQSWLAGLLSYQHALRPEARIPPCIIPDFAAGAFMEWTHAVRPDAVVGTGTLPLTWLREAGVRVPQEIGYVDLDLDPTLTGAGIAGIDQQSEAVGAAAIDLLVGQFQRQESGIPPLPKVLLVEGSWHDGATVIANGMRR